MNNYTIKYGDTLSGIASQSGKSVQELMRLNPSLTDPNKIRAGSTLNLGGTTAPVVNTKPTVTTTPTTTPTKQTINEVAKGIVPDFTSDPEMTAMGKIYKDQATQTYDPVAIRAANRARFQDLIDSINLAAQDMVAKFRNTTAKNRTGQSYALAAAGGRVGSATGEAEYQNVENMNNAEEQTYRDEAQNKVNALLGSADKDATDEINARRASIQQGAEKYIEFLNTQSQRKSTQVAALVKKMLSLGVDPSQISDTDIEKLQKQYGYNKDQLVAMFNDAKSQKATADLATKKAEADIAKNNTFDLSEGQARYVYDPVTGKATKIASVAKTYAPKSGSGSGSGSGTTTLGYDDPNYTIEAVRSSKGGRFLTQGELKPVTDIQQVVGQAETLTGLINTVDTGPIAGIIKSNNPYDTKAQLMKAQITAIVPKLARGVYGEVGVLTDADINNYSKTIANLKSTADVNKAVMAMTLDIATRSLANQLNSLAAGGRDVSNFEAIYTGLNKKASTLKNSLGLNTAPAASVDPQTQSLRDKYQY